MPARGMHIAGLAIVVASLAFATGTPPAATAAHPHKHRPGEPAGSRYPAGAQLPRRIARPGEYARHARLRRGTGGSAAPAGTRASRTTAGKKRKPKRKPGLHGDPARALLAYAAMQQAFYIPGSGLYLGEPYSYLWPFSQALAATVSVSRMPGLSARQSSANTRELATRLYGLGKYWAPPGSVAEPLPGEQPEPEEEGETSEIGVPPPSLPSYSGNVVPPAGVSYYDDNEWVGIELMRIYELRHEPPVLEQAERIMAFVMSAWQTSPKLACPGGIPFSDAPSNTDRNTVTDGPGAELALQLYRATGNYSYFQFALSAYEWVRACLLLPSGMYADHIRQHGYVDQSLWSYNQGSMIGAGTMLYQITGSGAYLYQARQTASAALSYFTMPRLLTENPFFASVYFRNLMYLDSVTRDPPGARLAQQWVDYMWSNRRLRDNEFVWGSPPASDLLVQAAVVQAYALLSTRPNTYF